MDITKINRIILDELSEAEKARILRFLSEDDTFKLSSTISRYIKTNPNFVKLFFNELLRIGDNGALFIICSIILNFFDEITEFLGQSIIYDLLKVSSSDNSNGSSLIVQTFLNNYDKFDEQLKEKLIITICNNNDTLVSLTYYLTNNLEYENPIYYKFSEPIKDFVVLKSVKNSTYLLRSLYKDLKEEVKEKALDLLVEYNKAKINTEYLIPFISENFPKFPENKKQFFLNKLFEVAKNGSSNSNNSISYEFNNLFKNLPNESFIELLKVFINKEKIYGFSCGAFIDKIPEELRNQILINQIPYTFRIKPYDNKYEYSSFGIYEISRRLSTILSELSEKNFNNSIKFLLDMQVGIKFLSETLLNNFNKFQSEYRNELLSQGLLSENERNHIFYKLLKELQYFPDLEDYVIKYIRTDKNILKMYRNDFIGNFNNYNEEVKKAFIEYPETQKIAYIAMSRNINLLSEDGLNEFIKKLESPNVPGYLISSFASNYKNFSEEIRSDILESLTNHNSNKKYIARIIFENFDLINFKNLNKLIEMLLDSEDKKVNYYLSKIINDFYEKIPTDIREKILNKVIKHPENINIFFPLIEEKLSKAPDEIINILSKSILSRNVIKKLAMNFFSDTDKLPDVIQDYLISLSKEYKNSRYLVWDFICNYNNIPEELRSKLLDNFMNTKNPDIIVALLHALINCNIEISITNKIFFEISENHIYLKPFTKFLSRNFHKINEELKINLLKKIYLQNPTSGSLLKLLIEDNDISQSLKEDLLTNVSKVLDSIFVSESLDKEMIQIAKYLKKNFKNFPEIIGNNVAKILFKNYSSRRTATLIIIENSKKLSDEVNSLLLIPFKENNLMIEAIEKVSLDTKEKTIKNILLNDNDIFIIKESEKKITNKWIKNCIVNYEKEYKKSFQTIPLQIVFQEMVQSYSTRDDLNQKNFQKTIDNYSSSTGILNSFLSNKYIRITPSHLNKKGLDTLFLASVFSKAYHQIVMSEIQSEKDLDEKIKILPLKIFINLKSINIIATKLRWDLYKFNENVRNELLILLTDYQYTDYVYFFVVDAIKYNIDKIPREITLKVINKLNNHHDWRSNVADELRKLLR